MITEGGSGAHSAGPIPKPPSCSKHPPLLPSPVWRLKVHHQGLVLERGTLGLADFVLLTLITRIYFQRDHLKTKGYRANGRFSDSSHLGRKVVG